MEQTKKKQPLGVALPTTNLTAESLLEGATPVQLNEAEVEQITQTLLPTTTQECRFIRYLGLNPLACMRDYCRAIACVNLSHLRRETAETLLKFGLEAKSIHPREPIKNGVGESTGQQPWAMYRLNAGGL